MLELPDTVLKNGYTITIANRQNCIRGSFVKRFPDGLHPYELPATEIELINNFPNIVENLSEGNILQVTMPNYLLCGIIGKEKTEGPYCEEEYLEVHEQVSSTSYYELLSKLDKKLSSTKQEEPSVPKQYKKIYKGESRYE